MYESQNIGHRWGMRMCPQKCYWTLENREKFKEEIQEADPWASSLQISA